MPNELASIIELIRSPKKVKNQFQKVKNQFQKVNDMLKVYRSIY
jgi:hypothetical protein